MRHETFARRPEGKVALDICFECQSIWFDQYESSQLSAGATIDLFRMIHERGASPARPVADTARCPRCRGKLKLTHDLQGTNRITYYRCPDWHGRLTTFFQFLREKHFVRSLSASEIERVRATVGQVRCSSCGAPVNVEKDAACAYCHAPLAILDAAAVERTLAELSAKERDRAVADPTAAIDALLAGKRTEERLNRIERGVPDGIDLVREALALFTRAL